MKQSKTIQLACDELIKKVRFENASLKLGAAPFGNEEDTEAIREATRVYIESWVVPIIERIHDGDIRGLKPFVTGS